MKGVGAAFRRWFGGFRVTYLPVLLTYLCFGASMVTSIALLYFEKDTLGLTPGEVAGIAFWLGLPWSMKVVVGVASDVRPIFGSRPRRRPDRRGPLLALRVRGPCRDGPHQGRLSLMNLALSASQPFTRYLNEGFAVSQHDYGNLGRL
jgi:hypothetical protein